MNLVVRIIVRTLCVAAILSSTSALAAGLPGAPPPFDQGGVRVALVNFLSAGDYFQAYEAGARRQAKSLGIELRVFPGRQDPAAQREAVEQAIRLGVDGIVINLGLPEALKDVAQQALDAGIKVVAYDVELDLPAITTIEQGDAELAQLVLDRAVADNGDKFSAGYIYVAGFAPLDRRDAVWSSLKRSHAGIVELARWGTLDNPIATSVANQTAAALRAHAEITVIFAPYNEFARGAKLAVAEAGLSGTVRIYSADIGTADIQEMREADSPWVATAATNPVVLGEVAVRTVALRIAGVDPGKRLRVAPALVTREQLLRDEIQNVEQLAAKVATFRDSPAAKAPWIPAPAPR